MHQANEYPAISHLSLLTSHFSNQPPIKPAFSEISSIRSILARPS